MGNMMNFSIAFWVKVLLGWAALSGLLVAASQPKGLKSILKNVSFSIKSIVTTDVKDKSSTVRSIESYSNEQHRAKVEFEAPQDKKSAGVYYHDSWTGLGLFKYEKEKSCSSGNLIELQNYLFSSSQIITFLDQQSADQDLSGYFGPAKLLFIVANNADAMKLIQQETRDGTTAQKYVRNRPVVEYELELPFYSVFKAVKFIISYYQESHTQESPRSLIPAQIVINFQETPDTTTIINYYEFKIKTTEKKLQANLLVSQQEDEKLIDPFTFPVSLNCSGLLSKSRDGDLFAQYDISSTRFSFVAHVKNFARLSTFEQFVAFDGTTQSMRIDSRQTNGAAELHKIRSSMKVFDFRTNRKYVVVERARTSKRGPLLELMNSKESQQTHCAVTYALPPDNFKRRHNLLRLSDLLASSSSFVYMGRAQVRGIRAQVFETYTSKLPFWSDEPQVYKDKFGNYATRNKYDRLKQGAPERKLNVLVYMALDEDEQLATDLMDSEFDQRLLLLEIYDFDIERASSYRIIFSALIYNFVWDLRMAPNGDRAHDLFAKNDLCAASSGKENKYAEVNLLLEEGSAEKRANRASADGSPSDFSSTNWIDDWAIRNEALTASIRDVMDIQNVMMYDLDSKLIKKSDGLRIFANFRVAEHPSLLYDINFIGYASLRSDKDHKVQVIFTMSLSECIWAVSEWPNHPVYLLYYPDTQACWIDLDLASNPDAQLSESKVIKLEITNQIGEVYKIEPQFDTEISLFNTWLRDESFRHLENRVFILQNIKPLTKSLPAKEIKLRIKKVELRNVNFMSRVAINEAKQIKETVTPIFSGFSLPEISAYSSRALPSLSTTKAFTGSGGGDTDIDKLEAAPMTLDQCRAACLVDLYCGSFSYCVRLPEIHCILANVTFDAPGIHEQLTSRSTLRLPTYSRVKVETNQGEVELIRDLKCELHNKIVMELFQRTLPVHAGINGLEVFPVESEEKCAANCFAKSLDSIESSAVLGAEINALLSKVNAYSSRDLSEQLGTKKKEYQRLKMNFCQYFMYLDSSLSEEQEKLLKRVAVGPQYKTEAEAYCAIEGDFEQLGDGANDADKGNSTSENELNNVYFEFDSYRFDFTKLYERKFGVNLRMSAVSQSEFDVISLIQRNKPLTEEQYSILKKTARDGGNIQLKLSKNPLNCAQECFFQNSALWPACRSFDVMILHQAYNESTESICALNTASLDQVESENVLTETRDNQLWHYEPRFGLLKRQSESSYKIELISKLLPDHSQTLGPSSGWRGGATVFIVVLLLSTASGLVLGVLLSRKLIIYIEAKKSDGPDLILTPTSRDTNQGFVRLT